MDQQSSSFGTQQATQPPTQPTTQMPPSEPSVISASQKVGSKVPGVYYELPSEPSVATVREQVQKPPTELQERLLTDVVNAPRKTTMGEFVKNLPEMAPAIPDAVTSYFMEKNGVASDDPRVVRLISLATQKFIADIVLDAVVESKMSGAGVSVTEEREQRARAHLKPAPVKGKKGRKEKKFDARRHRHMYEVTLTPELLEPVLKERGIDVTKTPYHH